MKTNLIFAVAVWLWPLAALAQNCSFEDDRPWHAAAPIAGHNPFTGGHKYKQELVGWPVRGDQLVVNVGFAFSSCDPERGMILPYDDRLEDRGAEVLVKWNDGGVERFTRAGNDYQAPTGITLRLTRVGNNFTVHSRNGLSYLFEPGKVANTYHLSQITDPNGNSITITRREDSLPTVIAASGGNQVTLDYKGKQLSEIVDPKKRRWSFSYEGEIILMSWPAPSPGSPSGSIAYHLQAGRLIQISYIDDGTRTLFEHDASGRLRRIVNPNDDIIGVLYAADATTYVLPGGQAAQRYVFENGRITSIQGYNNEEVATYSWNASNWLTSYTDYLGSVTRYLDHDANGNARRMEKSTGEIDLFTYQISGRKDVVTAHTGTSGERATYEYDANGNLQRTRDHAGAIIYEVLVREAYGPPQRVRNRHNFVTTATRNARGYVETISGPGTHPMRTLTRDELGGLFTARQGSMNVQLTRDDLDRLLSFNVENGDRRVRPAQTNHYRPDRFQPYARTPDKIERWADQPIDDIKTNKCGDPIEIEIGKCTMAYFEENCACSALPKASRLKGEGGFCEAPN